MQPNQISLKIPDHELTEIMNLINTLKAKLAPYLISLTPEQRREMLKMGDKTIAFVQKCLDHCLSNPELVPPFLSVEEFKIDVEAVLLLRTLVKPVVQVSNLLNDAMLLAGGEAYGTALVFYQSVKSAMKSNLSNASAVYTDLLADYQILSAGKGK